MSRGLVVVVATEDMVVMGMAIMQDNNMFRGHRVMWQGELVAASRGETVRFQETLPGG